jgi:3-dehydroquinate synthase class II
VELEEWSNNLATSEGEARSVGAPAPGDAVLVSLEAGARHFGRPVEETIWEK